jgi:uncharacterized protein YndB with AHSA1/START domain
VVKREISATPLEVFKAFTDPEIGCRWMGPGEVRCLSYKCDPVVGGRYRIHMQSSEGDHVAFGEYLEVDAGRKLVYTWSWEDGHVSNSRVTVRFHPVGQKTLVELMHELLPDAGSAASHEEGWTRCFDNMEALYSQA